MSEYLAMLQKFREDPVLKDILDNDDSCKALEASMVAMEKSKGVLYRMEKQLDRLKMERDAALNLASRYKKALVFYANKDNWQDGKPWIALGDMDALPDDGDMARAALGPAV